MTMSRYERFFGSGPKCLLVGLILIIIVYHLESLFSIPRIPISSFSSNAIFVISIGLTLIFFIWGFVSLPGGRRGKELVTTSAYKYIRHPVYAAFLDFFIFGLGFFLNSYGILLSGIILIFVCGKIVDKEERYCIQLFGKKYKEYQARTKKFIPKVY